MGEVFLWRGTAEQRARRSIPDKLGRFHYFDKQLDHPDWTNKMVLDFGGNEGTLLMDRGCAICPENYYCVDIISEALEVGRERFPQAHWVHYNRYNRSFNPGGIEDLAIPDMGVEFDFILAYSVFTHTTLEEMRDLVGQLQSRLKTGGTLAFTFTDPHYEPWPGEYDGNNLRWRLERANEGNPDFDVERLLRESRGAEWCAVVGGAELYANSNGVWPEPEPACMNYDVFYTVNFLRREFPHAVIRPPANDEMQHCCLIRSASN